MNYNIGEGAAFSKTISESDVYMYAGMTGDMNALHINEEYAQNSQFGGRIVHGMLVAGFISTVLGMKYPGEGTVYLEQQVKFCAPVKIGDTITAKVEVIEIINVDKGIVRLKTDVFNQKQIQVIKGYAVVKVPGKSVVR